MITFFVLLLSVAQLNIDTYLSKKDVPLGEKVRGSIILSDEGIEEVTEVKIPTKNAHLFEYNVQGNKIDVVFGVYKLNTVRIPLVLRVKLKDESRYVRLPGFKVRVIKRVREGAHIRPIKALVNAGKPGKPAYLSIFIFVAIALYAFFRMRKRPEPDADAEEELPQINPNEWAQEKLNEIKKQDHISKGAYKEYYDSISECIKTYLEIKYNIPASGSTLEELKELLVDKLKEEDFNRVRTILQECDSVKFTPDGKVPENIDKVWNDTYDLLMINEL